MVHTRREMEIKGTDVRTEICKKYSYTYQPTYVEKEMYKTKQTKQLAMGVLNDLEILKLSSARQTNK